MAALAVLAVLALAAGLVFVGYKFGARAVVKAIALERKIHDDALAENNKAHRYASEKPAFVRAEVLKIEAEAKAEEQSVVKRLKALL